MRWTLVENLGRKNKDSGANSIGTEERRNAKGLQGQNREEDKSKEGASGESLNKVKAQETKDKNPCVESP